MFEIYIGESELLELPEERPAWRWHNRSIKSAGGPSVKTILSEDVLEKIHREAVASEDEICGLLLGEGATWRGHTTLEITEAIAGKHAKAGPTHVTINGETWSRMLHEQDTRFPHRTILGWYHSHPRMEIFLSDMDLSIHRTFFPQPWHIALVINGQHQKVGLFSWREEEIVPIEELNVATGNNSGSRIELGSHSFPFLYQFASTSRRHDRPSFKAIFLLAAGMAFALFALRRKGG